MDRKLSGSPRLWLLACLAVVTHTVSCASVPNESVELSVVVGERITDMQASHEAFVQEYFRLSQDRVEDFLINRWVPRFLDNFVRDAQLMTLLDTPESLQSEALDDIRRELGQSVRISPEVTDQVLAAIQRSLGGAERGQIVLEFAEAATIAIERQRAELLGPIKAQEAAVIRELRSAYGELRAMQDAVTNNLRSIRKVQVQQDLVLARLNVLEARDKAIESAIAVNDRIVGLLAETGDPDAVVTKIRELKENF